MPETEVETRYDIRSIFSKVCLAWIILLRMYGGLCPPSAELLLSDRRLVFNYRTLTCGLADAGGLESKHVTTSKAQFAFAQKLSKTMIRECNYALTMRWGRSGKLRYYQPILQGYLFTTTSWTQNRLYNVHSV